MPPTWDRTHSPPGQEHHPPNIILNIKGETLVELYDDAYHFWHPATSTFLSSTPFQVLFGAPTSQRWEVREIRADDGPNNYYFLWAEELHGKRQCVMDLFGDIASGTRIGTHVKHEGHNQKWVFRSDGDIDG